MNKRISNELCEELFISELNVEVNFTYESFNKLLELYSKCLKYSKCYEEYEAISLRIKSYLNKPSIQNSIQIKTSKLNTDEPIEIIQSKIKKFINEEKKHLPINGHNNLNEELSRKVDNIFTEIKHRPIKQLKIKELITKDITEQSETFSGRLTNRKKTQKDTKNNTRTNNVGHIRHFSNICLELSQEKENFIFTNYYEKYSNKKKKSSYDLLKIPDKKILQNEIVIKMIFRTYDLNKGMLITNNQKSQNMLLNIKNLLDSYVLHFNRMFYQKNFVKAIIKIIDIYNEKYSHYLSVYEDYADQIQDSKDIYDLVEDEKTKKEMEATIKNLNEEKEHEIQKSEDKYNKRIKDAINEFTNLGFITNKADYITSIQDKILSEFYRIINEN